MLLTFLTPEMYYKSRDDHFSSFLKFENLQANIKLAVPDLPRHPPILPAKRTTPIGHFWKIGCTLWGQWGIGTIICYFGEQW